MASYDYLKTNYGPEKGDKHAVYKNLTIGASAGTFAVTITYPSDLVRKLM